jgi:hypothetical protein
MLKRLKNGQRDDKEDNPGSKRHEMEFDQLIKSPLFLSYVLFLGVLQPLKLWYGNNTADKASIPNFLLLHL